MTRLLLTLFFLINLTAIFSQKVAHYSLNVIGQNWTEYQKKVIGIENEIQALDNKHKENMTKAKDYEKQINQATSEDVKQKLSLKYSLLANEIYNYDLNRENLNNKLEKNKQKHVDIIDSAAQELKTKYNLDVIVAQENLYFINATDKNDITTLILQILNNKSTPESLSITKSNCAYFTNDLYEYWEDYKKAVKTIKDVEEDIADYKEDHEKVRKSIERGTISTNSANTKISEIEENLNNYIANHKEEYENAVKQLNEGLVNELKSELKQIASDKNYNYILSEDLYKKESLKDFTDITFELVKKFKK